MAMMIFKPPADFWVDQAASHKISATHKASEDIDEAGWIQGYILIINRIQRCKDTMGYKRMQGYTEYHLSSGRPASTLGLAGSRAGRMFNRTKAFARK